MGKEYLDPFIIPRHVFITWIYAQRKLPIKTRLARFQRQDTICSLCLSEEEDDQHILFQRHYAQHVWQELKSWWSFPSQQSGQSWEDSLLSITGTQAKSHITYAIFAARIYYIWLARNMVIFQNKRIPSHHLIQVIKEQVRNRIFFLIIFPKNLRCM